VKEIVLFSKRYEKFNGDDEALTNIPRRKTAQSSPPYARYVSATDRQPHSCRLAIRAPSARLLNFSQTISGSTSGR
jgi:hypothetical protein